jgi:tol-pal system protein YbgF
MTMQIFGPKGRGLLLVAFAVLSGCSIGVQPQPKTDNAATKPANASWKSKIAEIQGQIKKSDGIQNKSLSGVEHRLALLEKEVNELRGSVEVAQHNNQKLKSRLQKFETMEPSEPSPIPTAAQTPTGRETTMLSANSPVITSAMPEKEPEVVAIPEAIKPEELKTPASSRDVYESAYQKLLARKFSESLQEFKQFLTWYPDDNLADNAQYWIGELLYVQKQFPDALQAFNTVLVRWPSSTKVPGCLLKIGFAFYELGDMKNARTSLTRLVTDFPSSNAVSLANQRLKMIEERIGGQ